MKTNQKNRKEYIVPNIKVKPIYADDILKTGSTETSDIFAGDTEFDEYDDIPYQNNIWDN